MMLYIPQDLTHTGTQNDVLPSCLNVPIKLPNCCMAGMFARMKTIGKKLIVKLHPASKSLKVFPTKCLPTSAVIFLHSDAMHN